jgi:hypothetical protein
LVQAPQLAVAILEEGRTWLQAGFQAPVELVRCLVALLFSPLFHVCAGARLSLALSCIPISFFLIKYALGGILKKMAQQSYFGKIYGLTK